MKRISVLGALKSGVYGISGRIVEAAGVAPMVVADMATHPVLKGVHNAQNAAAAVAAVRSLGLTLDEVRAGLMSFGGLVHRMEPIGRIGKAVIVNDSKATNADAAAKALASYDRIWWIAGGKPKTGGIGSLAPFFPRIRKAYLIGVAAEEFAETLGDAGAPRDRRDHGRGRRGGARGRGGRRRGGRRAAVAGLRVLRPVPQLRATRRTLPPARHRPAGRAALPGERLMVSRAERSRLADWWFTVDKLLLTAFLCLIFGGIVLSLAASPAVAERIGIDDSYYFVKRQAFFALPAIAVMLFVSFMDPRQIRRFALVGFGVCVVLLVATLFIGPEIKGSRRWLDFKLMSIQPSEFMKPMFAVVVGFLLAEAQKRPDVPGRIFSFLVLGIVVALLVAQPDFGQTMLTCLAWAGLLFLAGMSWLWILGLAGAAPAVSSPPTRSCRTCAAASTASSTRPGRQLPGLDRAGGLRQRRLVRHRPGEGTYKRILPDSHTDFVFAVLGEEFGLILCMALVALFAFTVLRAFTHAVRENDAYVRLSTAGLAILFGLQSCINMAVNLHLMPAKGMTLPFISYGGSSLIAVAMSMGMLLALTRRGRSRPASSRRSACRRSAPRPDGDVTGMGKTFLIAAGGTGGHLFPAEALAHELGARGHTVHLATDHRATDYGRDFPAAGVHIVASATFGDRSPMGLVKSAVRIGRGRCSRLPSWVG